MSNNLKEIQTRITLIKDLVPQMFDLAVEQFIHETNSGTQKSSRLNLIDEMGTNIDNIRKEIDQIEENLKLLNEIESDVAPLEKVRFK
jgi:hypothetical protein